jgi:exosortase/archaeosortase family protein
VNSVLNKLCHPLWQLGMLLAALWPHWMWMARRSVDGSDEPWGILALLTLVALAIADHERHAARLPRMVLAVSAMLAAGAALSTSLLPPIIGAALAMLAVAALLSGMLPAQRPRAALAVLALLALPLAASLNFYLGYPLRWICTLGSAGLLALAGLHVTPEGAALLWNGKTVLVDAPCAGIAMLWVGMYAAALLSWLYRAGSLRTVLNLGIAVAIVVGGNTVRNAVLFFKEAGILHLPAWTHEAIGLAVFGGIVFLLFQSCTWRLHATR